MSAYLKGKVPQKLSGGHSLTPDCADLFQLPVEIILVHVGEA